MENKIILVIYVGISNFNGVEELHEYISSYKERFKKELSASDLLVFFVPDLDVKTYKIECINPVIVKDFEYQKILEKLENIEQILNK